VQPFFNLRRVVLILIALAVAFVTLQSLLFGTQCEVPSTLLKAGEVGTAKPGEQLPEVPADELARYFSRPNNKDGKDK
jgi:hypothetical protein